MGSYATLSIGSLELGSTTDDIIDPGLMWIFRPSDKRIRRLDRRNRWQLAKYVEEDFIDEYDENNSFISVQYRCRTSVARDRLELEGFTYDVVEAYFKTELEADVQRYEGYIRDDRFGGASNLIEDELRVLRSLTVRGWMEALVRIKEERLTKCMLDELPSSDTQLPLLQYMLDGRRRGQGFYGFPGDDRRHVARIVLEMASPQEYLTYDLTDLVGNGWRDAADDIVAEAENLVNEGFLLSRRVIVLTEGNTDRRILERSLRLLYPHLAEYFHFFDFTGRRVGGGAGELANLVRAFAAADVRHRILALFDNDTAAKAALSNLNTDSLPSNIAVRHYPSLPLAKDYPTLGPSGGASMDVNGLAGSIELYLGQDALKDDAGMFPPVQWTGYDRKIGAYQGEVLDKQRVLDRFAAKLACCETRPDQISHYDWEGIEAVVHTMRRAFHGIDTQAALSGAIHE